MSISFKFGLLAYLLLFTLHVKGKTIDYLLLDKEIALLNDSHRYEESIIKLEKIINAGSSSPYDRYQAYIQKSLTYKRLYNYTGALNNLDLALIEGSKSKHKEEVETRILIERIFIRFDLKQENEFTALMKEVKPENLHYINRETRAFYESILGHLQMRKDNLTEADKHFDHAIRLLEKENPRHLPNVYRIKVALYNKMHLPQPAMKAYERGLYYANKYNMDIYRIIMYETILNYYVSNEDYKNAYFAQKKVSEERTKYNAGNRSGQLNILENKLLQQRKDMELKQGKKIQYLYASVMVLLCILLLVLFKLFKLNRQRQVTIEDENKQMRTRIEHYMQQEPQELTEENLRAANLSARQLEIINLVCQGKTNKEIGAILFISENTVKYHLKVIYDLLDITTRSALKNNKHLNNLAPAYNDHAPL